jgi:hypothetical protein
MFHYFENMNNINIRAPTDECCGHVFGLIGLTGAEIEALQNLFFLLSDNLFDFRELCRCAVERRCAVEHVFGYETNANANASANDNFYELYRCAVEHVEHVSGYKNNANVNNINPKIDQRLVLKFVLKSGLKKSSFLSNLKVHLN